MDQFSIGISLGACIIFIVLKVIQKELIDLTEIITITLSTFLFIQAVVLIIDPFIEIPMPEFILTRPIAGIVVSYTSIARILKLLKTKTSDSS